MKLWLDIETRSRVNLRKGAKNYSTAVEVIMIQYAIEDGPVQIIEPLDPADAPALQNFIDILLMADEIWAHNAEFDRTMLELQPWWPKAVTLLKWRCTAALARMHGLPGGLDKLCQIFKIPLNEAKDKRGKEYIDLFCVPRKDGGYNDKHSHPNDWKGFREYGGSDITGMRAVYKKCPKWNGTERMWRFYRLDQIINARGIAIDEKLCRKAVEATIAAKARHDAAVHEKTLGLVETATQRNRLLAYMEACGVSLPDLTADTVERRLNDDNLPTHIKELLRIRQQASKASTAKYNRALTHALGARLYNMLVFFGAARTGRFAGRTIQPQNLPRPKHKQAIIDAAIECFKTDRIDDMLLVTGDDDVFGLASSCLRGMFVAGEGRKLCVADLANIEGRIMAWIAGAQWKLDAFAAYDAKKGPDLYKVAYARAFNIDPDEIDDDDWRRQIGKVMELALQYYGGVGAFCAMADTYRLDLDKLAESAWPVIPAAIKVRTAEDWAKAQKRRRTYGLTEAVWRACQALVILWREAHPEIVLFWHKLENAVKSVMRGGPAVTVGKVVVDFQSNWVRIRLPSGRFLCYPAPRIDADDGSVSFVGVNPYTRQWGRVGTYSGKLTENIVQAIAADILLDGLLAAEKAGYRPVLSVHDEIITEPAANDDNFTDKGLSHLMVSNSPWAVGCPLSAKGFTAGRYKK